MMDLDLGLYVITTEYKDLGRSHYDIALEAINGGAKVIQYREKRKFSGETYETAIKLRELTKKHDVMFIINDSLDNVLAVEADGIHIGQDDLPCKVVRAYLKNKIIGVSARNLKEAIESEKEGADYLGVGPIFETPSKNDAGIPMGCIQLKEICKKVNIPVVAIGGISEENIDEVIKSGAAGVGVISAVGRANNIKKTVQNLIKRIESLKIKVSS